MPDPRQIVVATTDFRPMSGGVADYLHRVAQSLAGSADVTVVTTVPQNGVRRDHAYRLEALAPLPQRRLGERTGDWFGPIRRLHTAAYFLELRRYAERMVAGIRARTSGDVVVVIGIWDTASHFWCEACRRAGLPYYLATYGIELVIPLYGRLPRWRRNDFVRAARVLAVSQATADLARERLGLATTPVVIHPSAGPRPSAAEIETRAVKLRQALGLDEAGAGPVLLSVGRLVPRKGFDLVLQSVSELQRDYPGLRYIVVGNGPERVGLEKRARELGIASKVRLLGHADEITKWASYELCDVFVMPNRLLGGKDWEGFGIVFVEAALAGRPSIAGRSGGTADAVVDQSTGLHVDPEDPGALTAAIRRLLDDHDLRLHLGREGEHRARTRFSGEALADRLRTELDWP